MGTRWNRLTETVLMSTHNLCFKKNFVSVNFPSFDCKIFNIFEQACFRNAITPCHTCAKLWASLCFVKLLDERQTVDPDQMQHFPVSDLGLQCLLRPVCRGIYDRYSIFVEQYISIWDKTKKKKAILSHIPKCRSITEQQNKTTTCCDLLFIVFPQRIISTEKVWFLHKTVMVISVNLDDVVYYELPSSSNCLQYVSSRKHAYIILTPLNPTFI